jgi:hypothetical protein
MSVPTSRRNRPPLWADIGLGLLALVTMLMFVIGYLWIAWQ